MKRRAAQTAKLATLAALIVLLTFGGRPATAYQIYTPNPAGTGQAYTNNSPPTAQPPFVHWDMREFNECSIPWSIAYPAGIFPPLDVNLDGTNNDATDKMLVQTALTAALTTWQNVSPSIIKFQMLGAAPAGLSGIARDNYNLFSFERSLMQDDDQCVATGGAAGGPFAPVVAPGADFQLTSQARQDDMISPCIIDGGNNEADTTKVGDDVEVIPAAGAVPGGCNAIITAGPNGVLDTPVNNVPPGTGDDRVSACVVAGPNGISNTSSNNQGTAGVGLTGLFFNNQTGVIQETDIEFGARFWTTVAHGAAQPQAVRAHTNGIANSAATGGDVANVMMGTTMLDQNSITINSGTNPVIDSVINANDRLVQTTDIQMLATHELGHTIGIAHPVNGRENDDVQVIAPGMPVMPPGGVVITAGPPPLMRLDTQPGGDDRVVGNTIVDGGNGVAETTANNARLSNSTAAGSTRNIMNPFFCTVPMATCPANHMLTIDDSTAANWLYTPDLGDAPDRCPWPPGEFNKYQTKVHSPTASGQTLNGVALFKPGKGPVQLFGYPGPEQPSGFTYNGFQFEWLGAAMTTTPASARRCPRTRSTTASTCRRH